MTRRSQLELDLKMPVRWGGAREGAGRKAVARARVWHRGRAEFPESHPGLVTIRVRRDVPSLRTARLARAVNRVFDRRGAVLDGRYHHRALGTPREVRAALAYVILNARKHSGQRAPTARGSELRVDPASSGRWFEGWARNPAPPADRPAVARAQTWLLRAGWRRHGLIRSDEVPGGERRHSRSQI